MILTLKETVEKTLVVETPSYYKYGAYSFLKIMEDNALYIDKGWNGLSKIEIQSPEHSSSMYLLFIENGEPITEQEFNAAFCEVHNQFTNLQLNLTTA